MSLLAEGIASGNVQKTNRKEKHAIDGVTREFDIYRIKTDLLYYNDQNDRIATWISEYDSSHDCPISSLDREEFNAVIEDFIVQSDRKKLEKTQRDIAIKGQLRPGIVLNDGRVIDGNRRLTCIRRISRQECEPGWFEAAILDDATGSDPKRIKLLELNIQMGEEEKVAYDPVDRLVGIYRDLIKDHLMTPAEYAKAAGITENEINKLIERAQYMEEFLEFCGAPEQYHLARSLKVDGPIAEFKNVLKKWDKKKEKEQVKRIMFANIVVQPEGDMTRYMRTFKTTAGTDAAPDFLKAEQSAMVELLDKMGPEPLTPEKVNAIRADEPLVENFSRAGERAKETVKRTQLMDAPAKNSAECLKKLNQIMTEMLDTLNTEELEKVRRNLIAVTEKANKLIEDIDERA